MTSFSSFPLSVQVITAGGLEPWDWHTASTLRSARRYLLTAEEEVDDDVDDDDDDDDPEVDGDSGEATLDVSISLELGEEFTDPLVWPVNESLLDTNVRETDAGGTVE